MNVNSELVHLRLVGVMLHEAAVWVVVIEVVVQYVSALGRQ